MHLDFDDTHVPDHPASRPRRCTPRARRWPNGAAASGIDLLAAHALGYELAARASNALYPEHYDAGWHMTGTTGALASATVAIRLLGLDGNDRHALPEHRRDPGRRPPRAVRHHDQAVPRRPRRPGGRVGRAACRGGIHRRARPAAGPPRHVRGDVVGEHARRPGRRARGAVADLRQRGEALRLRRGDPSGHRRGPRPRRAQGVDRRADRARSGCGCTRWCSRLTGKTDPANGFGGQVLGDVRVLDRAAGRPGRARPSSPTRPCVAPTSVR